jgi:hypothetical protein
MGCSTTYGTCREELCIAVIRIEPRCERARGDVLISLIVFHCQCRTAGKGTHSNPVKLGVVYPTFEDISLKNQCVVEGREQRLKIFE